MSEIDGGGCGGTNGDLDPRIQVELEKLNTATDEINKLEIELEEATTTFKILHNESTRRLDLLIKKLGNCIEKARPYYEALERSREAQIECQTSAAKFHRANEIHAAAKETVALAEQRFMSNSHEWQFDNAWQEMLNHATQKVMDAETTKAECHAEHQQKTQIFNAAELRVQHLEERYRRSIQKSRPYFEEKQICSDQLETQKKLFLELKAQVATAKQTYATALRKLEEISEEIHKQRGDIVVSGSPSNYPNGLPINRPPPPGPREPGVGAELSLEFDIDLDRLGGSGNSSSGAGGDMDDLDDLPSMTDSEYSLPHIQSNHSSFSTHSNGVNEQNYYNKNLTNQNMNLNNNLNNNNNNNINNNVNNNNNIILSANSDLESKNVNTMDLDLEEKLRQKVKTLAVRPVEGGDGCQGRQDNWEMELNATVDKLDHLMLMKECAAAASANTANTTVTAITPRKTSSADSTHYVQLNNAINKKSQETQTPTKMHSPTNGTGRTKTSFGSGIISSFKPHLFLQQKFSSSSIANNKKIHRQQMETSSSDICTPTTIQSTPTKSPMETVVIAAPLTPAAVVLQSISIDNLNSTLLLSPSSSASMPATPEKLPHIKHLKKLEPLPSVNVSMRELPLLAGLSNEATDRRINGYSKQRRRSLE